MGHFLCWTILCFLLSLTDSVPAGNAIYDAQFEDDDLYESAPESDDEGGGGGRLGFVGEVPFLSNALPRLANERRMVSVEKGLSKILNLRKKAELAKLLGRGVLVTPGSRCALSGKPIGDSMFKVWPSSTMVRCVFCVRRLSFFLS